MRYSIILAALLWFSQIALADVAGVKMGVGYWNQKTSGFINYQGTNADLGNGLQIDDSNDAFFWIAFEHPVPVLPNIKIVHTKLALDGSGTVNTSFTFGGTVYNVGNDVNSSLTLDQTDLILYYELVDTQVQLDLGINFKIFDGDAQVQSITAGANQRIDFSGPIPMLYGSLSIKLPLTGLSVGVEGSVTGYSGNTLSDIMARVSYVTKAKIGFEVGYRRLNLELDDLDSFNSDITIDGPFAAVKFNF